MEADSSKTGGLGVNEKAEALWEASRSTLPWAGNFNGAYEVHPGQIPRRASVGLVADQRAFFFKVLIEVKKGNQIGHNVVVLVITEQKRPSGNYWICVNEGTKWSVCGRPWLKIEVLECLVHGRCFSEIQKDGTLIQIYLTDRDHPDNKALEHFLDLAA